MCKGIHTYLVTVKEPFIFNNHTHYTISHRWFYSYADAKAVFKGCECCQWGPKQPRLSRWYRVGYSSLVMVQRSCKKEKFVGKGGCS